MDMIFMLSELQKIGSTMYITNSVTREFDRNFKKLERYTESFGIGTYMYNEIIEKEGNQYFYLRIAGKTIGSIKVHQVDLHGNFAGKKGYLIEEVRVNGDIGDEFYIKKIRNNVKKFKDQIIVAY